MLIPVCTCDVENAGKNVLIVRSGNIGNRNSTYYSSVFVFDTSVAISGNAYSLVGTDYTQYDPNTITSGSTSFIHQEETRITISLDQSDQTVVTSVTVRNNDITRYYIAADVNYSNPYTPIYNGSPATKKYVDDAISNSVTTALGGSY